MVISVSTMPPNTRDAISSPASDVQKSETSCKSRRPDRESLYAIAEEARLHSALVRAEHFLTDRAASSLLRPRKPSASDQLSEPCQKGLNARNNIRVVDQFTPVGFSNASSDTAAEPCIFLDPVDRCILYQMFRVRAFVRRDFG